MALSRDRSVTSFFKREFSCSLIKQYLCLVELIDDFVPVYTLLAIYSSSYEIITGIVLGGQVKLTEASILIEQWRK
jgi:hypothetical protein